MPNDKLPNPLPAGSVVLIPSVNGLYFTIASQNSIVGNNYNPHVLTSPVHLLDEGMLEAVRKAIYRLRLESSMWADVLEHAFAHVLTPPVAKEPTVREIVDASNDKWKMIQILADAIDAQQKSIDALRAELKEARNGR